MISLPAEPQLSPEVLNRILEMQGYSLYSLKKENMGEYIEKSSKNMKNIKTYEEFTKMGTSDLVKAHYSGEAKGEDGYDTIETQKEAVVSGKGDADHTETVDADNLGDPKNAQP
jgi:DNA phosphorothioation-dependent restriction protein DptG